MAPPRSAYLQQHSSGSGAHGITRSNNNEEQSPANTPTTVAGTVVAAASGAARKNRLSYAEILAGAKQYTSTSANDQHPATLAEGSSKYPPAARSPAGATKRARTANYQDSTTFSEGAPNCPPAARALAEPNPPTRGAATFTGASSTQEATQLVNRSGDALGSDGQCGRTMSVAHKEGGGGSGGARDQGAMGARAGAAGNTNRRIQGVLDFFKGTGAAVISAMSLSDSRSRDEDLTEWVSEIYRALYVLAVLFDVWPGNVTLPLI